MVQCVHCGNPVEVEGASICSKCEVAQDEEARRRPDDLEPDWRRIYSETPRFPLVMYILLWFVISLLFLYFFPWVGIISLVVGPMLIALKVIATPSTIVMCDRRGFNVSRKSKISSRQQKIFNWNDIVQTRFEFRVSNEWDHHIEHSFTVDTREGTAFRLTNFADQFMDLVKSFNRLTPHIPYEWVLEDEIYGREILKEERLDPFVRYKVHRTELAKGKKQVEDPAVTDWFSVTK